MVKRSACIENLSRSVSTRLRWARGLTPTSVVDGDLDGLPVRDLARLEVAEADDQLAHAGRVRLEVEDGSVHAVLVQAVLPLEVDLLRGLHERHQHQVRWHHGRAQGLEVDRLAYLEPQLVDILGARLFHAPESRPRRERAARRPTR